MNKIDLQQAAEHERELLGNVDSSDIEEQIKELGGSASYKAFIKNFPPPQPEENPKEN